MMGNVTSAVCGRVSSTAAEQGLKGKKSNNAARKVMLLILAQLEIASNQGSNHQQYEQNRM